MAEVVMSGVASEYVLGELAQFLRQRGHRVHEFDFACFKGDAVAALQSLEGRRCTYITSAHTNLSNSVAGVLTPFFVDHYPNYLSPLEILGVLNPKQSIYVPHDLLTPFGEENLNEYRYLDLFDHVLAPFSNPSLQAVLGKHTKVHTAGWIKHAVLSLPADTEPLARGRDQHMSFAGKNPNKPTVALFITMIEHLRWRYGDQGVFDYVQPLLTEQVCVKLPAWQGVEAVEALFQQNAPGKVFPSTGNSIELIQQSDLVVCNGASSIHAEASLLGCPVICLLDDEGILAVEQRRKLAHIHQVHFHDYRRRDPIPVELLLEMLSLPRNRPAPITFDYYLVESIIENQ